MKQLAGYGGDGDKGFDGVVTALQMETYLVVRDFKQRKNKKGESSGSLPDSEKGKRKER